MPSAIIVRPGALRELNAENEREENALAQEPRHRDSPFFVCERDREGPLRFSGASAPGPPCPGAADQAHHVYRPGHASRRRQRLIICGLDASQTLLDMLQQMQAQRRLARRA